ncbi:odorant receptor Or2-like [Maniola hyperantus]|uniref:odorant receptor Or2-like n=1 Tax=Aphantopus hyperantus TaxID=2795564 RepID=UPI0015697BE7|nr:odorant receptor Or2-like [Maniola hyperantus]
MLKHILGKLEDPEFPLLSPNIKALKFWGLLLPEIWSKKWMYIGFHISVIVFTATECAEILFVKDNMKLLLTNLKITFLATVSVGKVTSFLFWQKHWKSIINYVNEADKVQRQTRNIDKKAIIDKYTKYSRKITFYYWILMYTTVAILITQPMYKYFSSEIYRQNVKNGTETYTQVVSSWVPFNKNTIPGYILASLYQSYAAIYGGGWITSFDTNAIVVMVFFRGELECLRVDCSYIFGTENAPISNEEAKIRIKKCHKRHVELVKYSRLFDSCLAPIMLLYVIVCSVMLCATAYQITFESSALQRFIATEYLIFGVSQLFMYCWHSNEVLYVSYDLSLGPYESIWWSRDGSEQKDIKILTDQFKKVIVFSAGPFTEITVATFISILKGAYSYYTLLSQSQDD